MSGYAGQRRAARRTGGWSGGGGTGAEALVLRRDLGLVVGDGAVVFVVIGRRCLLRAGRAAMAVRHPHLDLPPGRVARTLYVGNGAPVACRLALVALDPAGPTREAASARASLDLAHGERLLPRGAASRLSKGLV